MISFLSSTKTRYYRWYVGSFITSEILLDLVGESRKCKCNYRTEECHPETGVCMGRERERRSQKHFL